MKFLKGISLSLALSLALCTNATAGAVTGKFGGMFTLGGSGGGSNPSSPLATGGGGWLVGADVQQCGGSLQEIVRTDSYGAYIWTGAAWSQLVTATSMPPSFIDTTKISLLNGGVYEIAAAPSNCAHLYMLYKGQLFTSLNRGQTWTRRTVFTPVADCSNSVQRTGGRYLAVDPANENHAYVAAPAAGCDPAGTSLGLFELTNGGASVALVAGVPHGLGPGELIAFDPSSGVTGGKTNRVWVISNGVGTYRTANAGASWSPSAGGPSSFADANDNGHMVVSPVNGEVYFVHAAGGATINYYNGSAWASASTGTLPGDDILQSVAVSPTVAHDVTVASSGGNVSRTLNDSAYGGYQTSEAFSGTDVPWFVQLLTQQSNTGTVGTLFYTDPSNLLLTTGNGVLAGAAPVSVGVQNWVSQTKGIEQLVGNEVVSCPGGGNPNKMSWDRAQFFQQGNDNPATTYYPGVGGGYLVSGWAGDCAYQGAGSRGFLAYDADWPATSFFEWSGFSTDNGETSQPFVSVAPPPNLTYGGQIAVSTPQTIIWSPSDNIYTGGPATNYLYCTNDQGQTWVPQTISGVPTTPPTGWHDNFYLNRHVVAADRTVAGTFLVYNYLTDRFYLTVDSCASWTPSAAGLVGSADINKFNAALRSVPGQAGQYFFSGGNNGDHNQPTGEAFYKVVVSGGVVSASAVPNVLDVQNFGFGKARPNGSGYAAIYINGWVRKSTGYTYGNWESDDGGATWTLLVKWPNNSIDQVRAISGDPDRYGIAYGAFQGSGFWTARNQSAQVSPYIWTIASGGLSETGVTITWLTDVNSSSTVKYGLTTAYGSTATGAGGTRAHSVVLSGLTATTEYHYQVCSSNAYEECSGDRIFFTISPTNQTALDGKCASGNPALTTTLHCALTTGSAGDEVIVLTARYAGTSCRVADVDGLVWHLRSTPTANNQVHDEWYAVASSALSADMVTVTCGDPFLDAVVAFGVSGVNTIVGFDGPGFAGAPDPINMTTTNPHTFAFAMFSNPNTPSLVGPSPWDATAIYNDSFVLVEYAVLPATQASLPVAQSGALVGRAPIVTADALVSK